MPTPLLILSRREVEELLPMGECIEAMAEGLSALARGEALQPLRSVLWTPDRNGLLGVMPGHLSGAAETAGLLGVKLVTVFPGNHARGEDSHQGLVVLFDDATGAPLAVFDAAAITAIRTAAVSGLATRLLAREGASDLAILGSGVQATTHLEAMRAVRRLSRVRVWSRDPEHARRFAAAEGERQGVDIEAVSSAREAVHGADLICTVTAAREPVLEGAWISPGAHVNAVGASTPATRELDAAAVARARLFVDRRESALNEAGDFLLALQEGAIDERHILGELGDLLTDRMAGRGGEEEITLFKSLGLAVEDLAAGRHLYRRATAEKRGTRFAM
ncbi:MAG TPA: ornithine cyclodeaminase family protein [Thermoanaerobaculia bacterium]|nr:ornithine cyclodeaminase family protein [Thermoanaerobaculia bacterium]